MCVAGRRLNPRARVQRRHELDGDEEPAAVVELGGAAGWNLKDGGSSFCPDIAAEVMPIENWLELEAGMAVRSAVSLSKS
jgi:hypothetical protein